ncbi:MAG TPA: neocarzinostatin apoprotein domain-containing protein [Jatrophihabitans sp.]|jgi:hypothetical protein|nr:neocarzinostatin apoprotein domain-containing protein [Jatrophihabitans sp.]
MNVRAGVAWIAAAALLAACGSEVPPDEFFRAQGGLMAVNGSTISTTASAAAPSTVAPSGASTHRAGSTGGGPVGTHNTAGSGADGHAAPGSTVAPGSATSTHAQPTPPGSAGPSAGASRPPTPTCTRTSTTPSVEVCPHDGLHDGQTVTVQGWNFTPNTALAIAECRDAGQSTNLSDCNIDSVVTYSPGAKVKSDADGHVGPMRITVDKTFKEINCATQSCLIAISEPTLNPDPNDEGDVRLEFA